VSITVHAGTHAKHKSEKKKYKHAQNIHIYVHKVTYTRTSTQPLSPSFCLTQSLNPSILQYLNPSIPPSHSFSLSIEISFSIYLSVFLSLSTARVHARTLSLFYLFLLPLYLTISRAPSFSLAPSLSILRSVPHALSRASALSLSLLLPVSRSPALFLLLALALIPVL